MGNAESRNARKVRQAIRQNDAATLQKLVKQKVDLDLAINHYSRNTPLILASCYASVDVIPTLLKNCKDKDAYNAEGHTALDKGIMFYSLANEYHPHKVKELLRRRRVVQLLVDGGVTRVRSAELELWIRVNKSDPVFIHTITHLFCRSNSVALKSIGFAVMLRINADLTCAACFLEAGATYRNYKLMYLSDLPTIDYKMPVNLAVLILQSTCDSLILQHIENIFLSAYPATKMKDEAREEILQLLLQNDHDIRYSHQKQYPEYDGLIEYHKHSLKSLKWLCRRVIRRKAYPNVFFAVHQLDLPKKLENYLLLNEDREGEDPTLNASKNLNMGSNPPSAQIVRRRTVASNVTSIESDQPRARPLSHFHPADEIERKRHRYSHSSVPSSPICPTASLAATSDFSPVKRRLRNQSTPYRQRPRSQAVARRDMPIIQISPILARKASLEPPKQQFNQDETDGRAGTSQKQSNEPDIVKEASNQDKASKIAVGPSKSQSTSANKENTNKETSPSFAPSFAKQSPKIPVRKMPLAQGASTPVVVISSVNHPMVSYAPNVRPTQIARKDISQPSKQLMPVDVRPVMAMQQKQVQSDQRVSPVVRKRQGQQEPNKTPNEVKESTTKQFHNISLPRPVASTKVVGSIKQPVLSTFAPHVVRPLSPRRSPRDAKRQRPHSHFIPATEVRNIFPPPNLSPNMSPVISPQVRSYSGENKSSSLTRSYTPGCRSNEGSINRKSTQMTKMMSQSYHAPGRLAGHIEFDAEFASHLEEALNKRQSNASDLDGQVHDAECDSHLEEVLMKRRSQPPGQFLPTKEVLIDFGTPTDSPLAVRSAGSTLNRQEVLLRPGSASLPRADSSKRRSRYSPPSSPFNLKVNPRFIVAASGSTSNIVKPAPPSVTGENTETKESNNQPSDSDYDEIDDSSDSSGEGSAVNENEGYTRF